MNPQNQITLYQTADGSTELDVHIQEDTVWLRQEHMSELFGRERSVISKHLRNIFAEGELEASSVCANFAHTAEDGKTDHEHAGGARKSRGDRKASAVWHILRLSAGHAVARHGNRAETGGNDRQ